jgi:hypothetical protein
LAEFCVAVKVLHGMIIRMTDGVGGADVGAGKAGDAILGMRDHAETLFRVQFKNSGRTDIDAEFASPA